MSAALVCQRSVPLTALCHHVSLIACIYASVCLTDSLTTMSVYMYAALPRSEHQHVLIALQLTLERGIAFFGEKSITRM